MSDIGIWRQLLYTCIKIKISSSKKNPESVTTNDISNPYNTRLYGRGRTYRKNNNNDNINKPDLRGCQTSYTLTRGGNKIQK